MSTVPDPCPLDLPDADGFAEPLARLQWLIVDAGSPDESASLTSILCASLHPDYVCNLADVHLLSQESKSALLDFFAWSLRGGLTLETRAKALAWVAPQLSRIPGTPSRRGS